MTQHIPCVFADLCLSLDLDQLVVGVFPVLGRLVAQLLRIPLSGFDNGMLDTRPLEDTRYVLHHGSVR